MKQTNLKEIKKVAIAFLYIPVERTKFPFLVQHPIFESNTQSYKDENNNLEIVDILESEENLNKIIKKVEYQINNAKNLLTIYLIIRKSYRLTFFKYIKDYLSEKDFAELLEDAWVSSENPNQDVNCSISEITSWFKKAKKELLMNEEDYQYYKYLPKEIEVYRGVAEGRNPDGLSWTDNYEKAKWFADRWHSNGEVRKGIVKKENVLAYFNTRDEQELVINVKNIQFI